MTSAHHDREPTDDEIRHEAYLLWLADGRAPGRDVEHWHTAREILRHRIHVSGSGAPVVGGERIHFPASKATQPKPGTTSPFFTP